jgi:glycosyltransferase involved in cell wall biosynthesis
MIRRRGIEIVSGHGRMFPVWLACRLAGVPLVWTLHGAATSLEPRRFDLKSAVVRVAFRRLLAGELAHIVGVSEFTRTCFLQMIGLVDHSNVSVIRNGSAALPHLSELPVPTFKGVLRLGYVGRIESCKGVFDFAPLCQRLLDLGVPFSLRIYGNGSEEGRLRCALARWMRLGVVSFGGYEGDPRKIYSSFDVLVHPARAEWLGMSLIECQAAARIAIAYRSGGVPEIVTDSVSGFTLPVGDTDSIASTVESLHKNPAVAVQIALKAREMVKSHCSLRRMCGDYELLFEKALC